MNIMKKAKGDLIMTKFSNFDRKNLKNLRSELEAVLAKYGADANLDFEIGNMRFDATVTEIKVKATVKGAETAEDRFLLSQIKAHGLVQEKNGARLIRYDTKKHKYPFIYESAGKRYKTDLLGAKMRFAA